MTEDQSGMLSAAVILVGFAVFVALLSFIGLVYLQHQLAGLKEELSTERPEKYAEECACEDEHVETSEALAMHATNLKSLYRQMEALDGRVDLHERRLLGSQAGQGNVPRVS